MFVVFKFPFALAAGLLLIPITTLASDPFGPQTLYSKDVPSKLVSGEMDNSIVGGLKPCMVAGDYCPAIWVRLYNGDQAVGTLIKTGPKHWREYSYIPATNEGVARFNFTETAQQGNLIQLHDASRNVQLEIDLDKDVIRYGEDGGPKRLLYRAYPLKSWRD